MTLTLERVPLGEALQRLTPALRLDLRIEPGLETLPVSVIIEHQDPRVALLEVLRASGVHYVAAGVWRTDGESIKIAVGDPGKAVPATAAPLQSKDPSPVFEAASQAIAVPAARIAPSSTTDKEGARNVTAGEVVSAEQQAAINEGLEATRKAADAIPLMRLPATSGDLLILPFPDKTGKPIPITAPPKKGGIQP